MKTSPFTTYQRQTRPNVNYERKIQRQVHDETIKGVLLNKNIKKDSYEKIDDFDRISNQLLIPQKLELPLPKKEERKEEKFDYKKALKPIAIVSGLAIGATILISGGVAKYSKALAKENDIVRPGDLARNINILEEPHFAMYRVLRDPNAKNILGLVGVGIFSAVSLAAKNFVDGAKEIWTKKQNCDIEHDLEENMIAVEAEAFSGKLNVVNTLLSDTTKYFKSVLSTKESEKAPSFKNFLSFKGDNKQEKEDKKKNTKEIIGIIGGIAGIIALSYGIFRNYQKTVKNLDTFVQKYEHNEIVNKINKATSTDDKQSAISQLIDLFKVINAKDDTMQTHFSKIKGITEKEINEAIKEVQSAQIYAQAPEAMGGIAEKIQYYCYINEDRGHLYNWILNPENKFNKYIFLCFSAISSLGYVSKQVADAIKDVIVNRENSKSELELKRNLVATEISNFKTKKLSAINPLIDNFIYQLEHGKSKEELKELAENILVEIKNGPPYVYS